jgi:hypothetical protein
VTIGRSPCEADRRLVQQPKNSPKRDARSHPAKFARTRLPRAAPTRAPPARLPLEARIPFPLIARPLSSSGCIACSTVSAIVFLTDRTVGESIIFFTRLLASFATFRPRSLAARPATAAAATPAAAASATFRPAVMPLPDADLGVFFATVRAFAIALPARRRPLLADPAPEAEREREPVIFLPDDFLPVVDDEDVLRRATIGDLPFESNRSNQIATGINPFASRDASGCMPNSRKKVRTPTPGRYENITLITLHTDRRPGRRWHGRPDRAPSPARRTPGNRRPASHANRIRTPHIARASRA